jgi:nucleoside-diphosphate-sugar epimerase
MKTNFLIFGFGYTAKFLSTRLIPINFKVIGTTRTCVKQYTDSNHLKIIDFNCSNLPNYIEQATHILISIPPSSTIDDLVLHKYGDLIRQNASHIQWLGYLSSTGVYGDHKGNWVNEESECMPHTPTAIARLKSEQSWLSYAQKHHLPLHIFRLSGIYGPSGRNAIQRFVEGKKYSVFKKEQVFCRIHVEDIVSTILASISSPNPLSIYNVSDDEPAPSHVVDHFVAKILKRASLPLIPFSDATLSPMEQEFYASNRRVSNLKIKKELGITLQYPTFREGLTQIHMKNFQ